MNAKLHRAESARRQRLRSEAASLLIDRYGMGGLTAANLERFLAARDPLSPRAGLLRGELLAMRRGDTVRRTVALHRSRVRTTSLAAPSATTRPKPARSTDPVLEAHRVAALRVAINRVRDRLARAR